MNIILDECLPRRLLKDLPAYSVTTVPRQGWNGITNGALLDLVTGEFDVFVTMDSNIVHQQNVDKLEICLIVLHGPNSNYETLQPLIPELQSALQQVAKGAVLHVGTGQ